MTEERDVKFASKKVDESWKAQMGRNKDVADQSKPASETTSSTSPKTSKLFINLLTSLGFQAMMHLGEIHHPETQQKEVNIDAAREIIDLLVVMKEKSEGRVSVEEKELFNSLVPELQMKFSQHV